MENKKEFDIMHDQAVKAHISLGNTKIGRIANFNMTPGISCSACACKTCHVDGCYAMKSYRRYLNVRIAWNENTAMALFNLDELEKQIREFLSKKRRKAIKYFRIHSAGDFITAAYADMWFRIAADFPEIRFLAFTKQFDIVRGIPFDMLKNFSLVMSNWYEYLAPDDLLEKYAQTFVVDDPKDSMPENSVLCPGSCVNCKACWYHKNVVFKKH